MSHPLSGPIEKVVVLRGGALGDVLLTVPALAQIRRRFPEAKITLVSDPYAGPVIAGLPYFDEVVISHAKDNSTSAYLKAMKGLKQRKFDLLIDIQGTGRSRIQTMLIGGRNRMGYQRSGLRNWFYTMLGPLNREEHRVRSFMTFLTALGIQVSDDEIHLELPVTSEHRAEADEILRRNGVTKRFVVIHPTFSKRPPNEVWPDGHFAELVKEFTARGFQVVMTSGADGQAVINRIQSEAGLPVINLAGQTKPLVLAAVLEKAELYFGYNTGPMHVAAAMDTAIVTIFEEPSKYLEWHPWTRAPFKVLLPTQVSSGEGQPSLWQAATIMPAEVMKAVDEVLASVPRP